MALRGLRIPPGTKNSIVIGIRIGEKFSSASYAIAFPGEIPFYFPVRFSQHGINTGTLEVPTIAYYDSNNPTVPRAIGHDASSSHVIAEAKKNCWLKIENSLMCLSPAGQRRSPPVIVGANTDGCDLPPGKSAEEVTADFLSYLVRETSKCISCSHADGLWARLKDEIIYVFVHPEGWSYHSLQRYRTSAVLGGLIADGEDERITFVSNFEAKAMLCLQAGAKQPEQGDRFVIIDAGRDTIEGTTIEIVGACPLQYKTCTTPTRHFMGPKSMDMNLKGILKKDRLACSKFDDDEFLDVLVRDESESLKKQFNGGDDGLLMVGGRRESDEKLDIIGGFLLLHRAELAECFKDYIDRIIECIMHHILGNDDAEKATPVWLIGGAQMYPYVLNELRKTLEQSGTVIDTPLLDELPYKVTAGAVLCCLLGSLVVQHTCKMYGTFRYTPFDPSRHDHRNRPGYIQQRFDGTCIGPVFHAVNPQGDIVAGETYTLNYHLRFLSLDAAAQFKTVLLCYEGNLPAPYWYNENKDKFRKVCRLEADLSPICIYANQAPPEMPPPNYSRRQWIVSFDIELKFWEPGIEARTRWEDRGVIKYGQVKIHELQ